MQRRVFLVCLAVLVSACGGGSTPASSPAPSSAAALQPVALDSPGFDARVAAGKGAALVEFQSPT